MLNSSVPQELVKPIYLISELLLLHHQSKVLNVVPLNKHFG
ncbi:MAG: hypothetical protein ACTS7I_00430 [Candidatus Hodgkinia cicadicola]